jgi:hypothetical protein
MPKTVKGFVDLSVVVAILFEDVSQANQLGVQAAFIIVISGLIHQSRQYRLFIGWVIMELGFEVNTGVCRLGVHYIQAEHYVTSVDSDRTEDIDRFYGVLTWCCEWPLSKCATFWAKR